MFVGVHHSQVRLYTLEENHMLRFKVETHVGIAAGQTFELLSDLRRRKEWDQHYKLVPPFQLECCSDLICSDLNTNSESSSEMMI